MATTIGNKHGSYTVRGIFHVFYVNASSGEDTFQIFDEDATEITVKHCLLEALAWAELHSDSYSLTDLDTTDEASPVFSLPRYCYEM